MASYFRQHCNRICVISGLVHMLGEGRGVGATTAGSIVQGATKWAPK